MREDRDENDIEIDKHNLDEEWVRQPRLRRHWGKIVADLMEKYEKAKNMLRLAEAEADLEVRRREPADFGLGSTMKKWTEPLIENLVVTSRKYQEAHDAVVAAKHELNLAEKIADAVDDRKWALEKLVPLFFADYYADPRPPRERQNYTEDVTKKALRMRGRE